MRAYPVNYAEKNGLVFTVAPFKNAGGMHGRLEGSEIGVLPEKGDMIILVHPELTTKWIIKDLNKKVMLRRTAINSKFSLGYWKYTMEVRYAGVCKEVI